MEDRGKRYWMTNALDMTRYRAGIRKERQMGQKGNDRWVRKEGNDKRVRNTRQGKEDSVWTLEMA